MAQQTALSPPLAVAATRCARPAAANPRPLLRLIGAHVREHIGEKISVDDLAQAAGLSVFQLIRVFRRQSATTPYAFVLQLRVDRAKELLLAGTPIVDAAAACGFADQSHLTRHFRRLAGTTPKRFQACAA